MDELGQKPEITLFVIRIQMIRGPLSPTYLRPHTTPLRSDHFGGCGVVDNEAGDAEGEMRMTCEYCNQLGNFIPNTQCPCGARLRWRVIRGHRKYFWEKFLRRAR